MEAKTKLKQFDEFKNVYVNDFLCKESLQLLNYAKSLKSIGYKFIFAKGGAVFAKRDTNTRQIRLRSMSDVDDILCKRAGGVTEGGRRLIAVDQNEISSDDDDDSTSLN